VFLFSAALFAQKEYIEKNKKYSLARVYQKNKKTLKVNNLQLINDSIMTYKIVGSQQQKQVLISELKYVSVKTGSHALTYGLIGAGSGLLGSLLGVASVKTDPYLGDSEVNYAPIVIGITVGFGAIGAIIGAFNYKWKRLYFVDNSSTSFLMYPSFQGNSYGLTLAINF